MTSIILIIIAFGVLILIHELGHFIVAKMLGIKVLQFSIGLGKEIFSKKIGDTKYSLCVLPIGGAVRLKGENIENLDLQQDSFFGKKWYQRILVVISGPLMNYFLAVLIFSSLVFFFGVSKFTEEPIIGEVLEKKPAYNAGLKSNDRIIKINNKKISLWKEMAEIIHNSAGKTLEVEVQRGNEIIVFNVIPEKDPISGKGIIGILPAYEVKKVSIGKSIIIGIMQPINLSIYSIKYLFDKITKLQKPEVAGPVGIIQVLTKSAKTGIENFLYTVGIISTMLGLFNLFPIPLLDGGHLFFSVVEGITKKIPSKKVFEIANFIGLSILLFIFMFATYSDIIRIFYNR
ncbi:MAG: RIP metalloprotease RseP [Endomicrobia bacterium]|nr:RIP metalloprotease RseP [Endomicrobiia bacterium]MCX7941114.1 RIP metalloprotease RseP [Endomicrobiia bacterium]MDW8055260.1 RIP metalloprotease RseP [Elusimicrobiota bacterium]